MTLDDTTPSRRSLADALEKTSALAARRRALQFGLLAAVAPVLAACPKGGGQQGGGQADGIDTMRKVREQNPHRGR